MKYRAEIDGLRALAVLPVILFHAGFSLFSGGFAGVDVFFVISGFLITTIIIDDLEKERFSILHFYERRARRILPALFVVVLVSIPLALFTMPPSDIDEFAQSLVSVSLFSSNILFWLQSGYFDTAAELKPMLHTWSLAVEEQYYIFFPLLLAYLWRLGHGLITKVLLVIFVVSIVVAHWASVYAIHPKIISGSFFLLPTRAWELIAGGFVALYVHHSGYVRSFAANQVFSLIGLALVSFALFGYDKHTPFPSLYALVPVLGTSLIIMFAVEGTLVARLLRSAPLVGIGLVSYSAYLWHQPIMAFARYRYLLEEHSDLLMFGLVIASLIAAYASWRWIERPFRQKNRVSGQAIFKLSGFGLGTTVAVGLVLLIAKPSLSPTFDRDLLQAERFAFMEERYVPSGQIPPLDAELPHLLFVGDSMWKDAVNILGQNQDFYYSTLQLGGCPATNQSERFSFGRNKACVEMNAQRFSADYSSYDGVVIMNRFHQFDPAELEPFLSYLKQNGAKNVLIFGNYLGFDNQAQYMDRVLFNLGSEAAVQALVEEKRLLNFTNLDDGKFLELREKYGFSFLSIASSACENGCKLFVDSIPFTYDVHHFTLGFSKFVAERNDDLISSYFAKQKDTEYIADGR